MSESEEESAVVLEHIESMNVVSDEPSTTTLEVDRSSQPVDSMNVETLNIDAEESAAILDIDPTCQDVKTMDEDAEESAAILEIDPSCQDFRASVDNEGYAYGLAKALRITTQLKSLFIECRMGDGERAAGVLEEAVATSSLTHLHLSMRDDGAMQTHLAGCLLSAARRSPSIQHLEVFSSGDGSIQDAAACLPYLQGFSLEGEFDQENIEYLRQGLEATLTLTQLELHVTGFESERTFSRLSQALGRNTSVTTLILEPNGFDDESVTAFVQRWNHNSRIQSLKVGGIGPTGAMLLIEAVSNHPAMENLSFQGNGGIGLDGLVGIAMELPNIVLRTLNVASCAYYSEGEAANFTKEAFAEVARCLAQGMSANTSLVKMDVSGNGFDDVKGGFCDELEFYLLRNRHSTLAASLEELQSSTTLWCNVFAVSRKSPSFIFQTLQELPVLWQECHRAARQQKERKRRIDEDDSCVIKA